MSWRYQPAVLSPVDPAALLTGIVGALGGAHYARQSVCDELSRRYAASAVLLTDSGTSALVVALRTLLPVGATIAFPAYACIDLTAAALRAGVRVRLYDIDPMTLSPDLDSVRKAMERGVDAILVAHLYGYPADVTSVKNVAKERGVLVIEDAAQAAGGKLGGKRLGELADVSVLSFGRGKGTTAGSGGALLARSLASVRAIDAMTARFAAGSRGGREVFALAAQWMLARSELYRLPASIPGLRLGEMVFRPAGEPRPMSATAAAILPSALKMEGRELAQRRERAGDLLAVIRKSGGRLTPIHSVPDGEPGFLRLPFLDAIGDMAPNASVGAMRGYPLTLDQHDQLRPILADGERAGPGAQRLRDRLFTAPTHSRVTTADIRRFQQWVARLDSPVRLEALAT
jgi:perosamine synthetase